MFMQLSDTAKYRNLILCLDIQNNFYKETNNNTYIQIETEHHITLMYVPWSG